MFISVCHVFFFSVNDLLLIASHTIIALIRLHISPAPNPRLPGAPPSSGQIRVVKSYLCVILVCMSKGVLLGLVPHSWCCVVFLCRATSGLWESQPSRWRRARPVRNPPTLFIALQCIFNTDRCLLVQRLLACVSENHASPSRSHNMCNLFAGPKPYLGCEGVSRSWMSLRGEK